MNPRPKPFFEGSSKQNPEKFLLLTILLAVPIAIILLLPTRTARSRLNVMQVISVLFYLLVIFRQAKTVSPGPEQGEINRGYWGLLLALAVGAAVWAPVLQVGFVSDDFVFTSAAQRTDISTLWQFVGRQQAGTFFRPVGFALIFFDYHLWHNWAVGYHATNLLLHLLTIAGVFFLCEELGFGRKVAATSSTIFAVLPSHAEAIAWMVSRFDLLSACFGVWAVVLYLKFRKKERTETYLAALMLFLLAVLSKENAYMLPFLLLLFEYSLKPKPRFWPLFGFFCLAAILFCYRWILLGGIGGYADVRGQPATLQLGFKTFEGVFIRGPAQILLGYNWLQPPVFPITLVASLTAAALLLLALRVRVNAAGGKRIAFCASWLILTIAPAHPLLLIGAGLSNSRVLYLGSIGVALLLGLLLADLSASFRTQRLIASAIVFLLALGAFHNLRAWQQIPRVSSEFLSELQQLEPSPSPNATFVFHGMPDTIRGVFFLREGLSEAIRMAYGRNDLSARRASQEPASPRGGFQDSTINLEWVSETPPLLRRIPN